VRFCRHGRGSFGTLAGSHAIFPEMPKKPSRPVGHIVFPRAGTPFGVSEFLPDRKEDLEATLARKFVESMQSRFGRMLSPPFSDANWPDFWSAENGHRVGVEIVEVVNPDHIALEQIRRRYADRLRRDLKPILENLRGVDLEIDDGYQHRRYPEVNARGGDSIVEEFRNLLETNRDRIRSMRAGSFLHLRARERLDFSIGFVVTPAHDRNAPASIWYGNAFPVSVDRGELLVREAIERKLSKRYSRPRHWSLWLLAYDANRATTNGPVAADQAHQLLCDTSHPFTEAWFMVPTAGDIPSFLESVWPSCDFTSLGGGSTIE
jgi:hypothetical protein